MDIIVISLPKAVERRNHVKKQFSQTNLDYMFFDAIEPINEHSDYFATYDEYQYLLNTGRKVTRGEIGCYASHLKIWKQCVEINKPILIMEDDFNLNDNFTQAVIKSQSLIEKYGYIRLQQEHRGKKKLVSEDSEFSLVYYTKMPHSTMCYAISPTVAKTFINHSKHLTAPVDVMIKKIWSHKQRLYGLMPYSIDDSTHHSNSNIPGRVKQPKSIPVKTARFLRKLSWIFKRIAFTVNFKPPLP